MIEKEPILFEPFKIEPEKDQYELCLLGSKERYGISPTESQYLQFLVSGTSIEVLVHHFIGQGWLVNFVELFNLLQFLTEKKIIRNPRFAKYFEDFKPRESESLLGKVFSIFREDDAKGSLTSSEIKKYPFFRTLPALLIEAFANNNRIIKLPERFLICKAGDDKRDLFLLLSGRAEIYRKVSPQKHQYVATLSEGSVFGEGAFLLNSRRSADVLTLAPSKVVRFKYRPEIFDTLVQSEPGSPMQKRFWLLNAFQNSDLFKNMPSESFDQLLFKGEFVNCKANEVLFHEGDKGFSFFIIVQGSMSFYQGKQKINSLSQGASFGEMALFISKAKRTTTVVADRDCLLLEITQKEVYEVLAENLFLAKEMQMLAFERLEADAKRSKRRA